MMRRLFDLVVSANNNFIGSWRFIPADETMGSGKDKAGVNDGSVTELTVAAETLVGQHDNVWILAMNRWTA